MLNLKFVLRLLSNGTFQKFQRSGFTLVETLMVMLILATVMLAASGLANTVLNSSAKNQNVVAATYLAQECTELSRNVRDSAWRQNLPWMCPFVLPGETAPLVYDATSQPEVFGITPGSLVAPLCNEDLGVSLPVFADQSFANLYRPDSQALNYESSGEPTDFKRYITVDDYVYDPLNNSSEIELTCHVTWLDGGVQMTQKLTNWRQP